MHFSLLQWTIEVAQRVERWLAASDGDRGVRLRRVDSLDKYSGFIPADDRSDSDILSRNGVVGIGVEIKPDKDEFVIIKTLPQSASRSNSRAETLSNP